MKSLGFIISIFFILLRALSSSKFTAVFGGGGGSYHSLLHTNGVTSLITNVILNIRDDYQHTISEIKFFHFFNTVDKNTKLASK